MQYGRGGGKVCSVGGDGRACDVLGEDVQCGRGGEGCDVLGKGMQCGRGGGMMC